MGGAVKVTLKHERSGLHELATWQLTFVRPRILEDLAYFRSGARPLKPLYVAEEDVPVILANLRLQLAEVDAELRRRGVVIAGSSQ